MAKSRSTGIPTHQWNPYTPMDQFGSYFGFGPTVLVRGEGNYVFNQRGKRYILGNSAAWNFALGYGRAEIIEAAVKQLRELPFSSSWGLTHPRAMELAARLVEISSGNFAHAYLTSDGTEAVEAALKIARQFHRQSPDKHDHQRYKVITLHHSYHGYSFAACSASGSEDLAEKYGPLLPGFVQIEPAYCYRCSYGSEKYPQCGLACAQALELAIEKEGPETVAAFLYEPVLGEAGVIVPPDEYHQRVGEICRRYGLLLIADEVTTGFGRAGKLFFSKDWEIQPDILCLGKIISGGYLPLGATLTTGEIFQRFLGQDKYFMHGSTNSGQPVCAAAGLAAIGIILRDHLPENAARVGAHLKSGLEGLVDKHEIIGEVRGKGLMLHIELVKDRKSKQPYPAEGIFNFLLDVLDRGLLISLDDFRIFPPLTIDESLADEIVDIIDKSLKLGVQAEVSRKSRLLKEFLISKESKNKQR